MKIATWNVNSIKIRVAHLVEWINETGTDVILLQELKSTDEAFPREPFEDLGYNIALVGQKTYNGVGILSKYPIDIERRALPGNQNDEQARYIEAIVNHVRVCCLYLPNGNPIDSQKFVYKLAWMDRLIAHTRTLLTYEDAVVLGGDFNVCPTDDDVYDPDGFAGDALCHPDSRAKYRSLCHLGYTDAFRTLHPQLHAYSFWDYQAGCWNKDYGLRIDHLLLSPQATDRLTDAGIDKAPRGKERPSDHTPVWCELKDKQ